MFALSCTAIGSTLFIHSLQFCVHVVGCEYTTPSLARSKTTYICLLLASIVSVLQFTPFLIHLHYLQGDCKAPQGGNEKRVQ